MADKSINDLNFAPGTIDDANTLFVVSQSGTAYKVSGHEYITALGTILDGHGGIKTIAYTAPVAPSLDGTLTITLADDDVETLTITNGKGFASSSPVVDYWAASSSNSTTPSTWYTTMQTLTDTNKYLWHYQHYAFNDGTSFDTTKTVIGVYGDKGDNSYVWIRYSGSQPTSDSDMGTTPDDWMGIYAGNESDPSNLHYTDYAWFCIKGETGDTGDPATIVTQNVSYQTSSSGTVAPSGSWTSNIPTVTPGDFLWTRTQIQFNTGNPIATYSVSRYGIDGAGSVSTVNSISPDANGNVALTADDIPMPNNVSVEDTIVQIETDVGDVSNLTTAASNCVGAINEVKTNLSTVKSDIGIVEDTNTATHTIAKGQYVIWKDALYIASRAIPLGTTLSSSNLTAVSGGGFNALPLLQPDWANAVTISNSALQSANSTYTASESGFIFANLAKDANNLEAIYELTISGYSAVRYQVPANAVTYSSYCIPISAGDTVTCVSATNMYFSAAKYKPHFVPLK